jgi:hypothetical protein
VKFNQLSKKNVVFNPNGTARYFLTQVPDDSKFEFREVPLSPFLPETGLQDLTVKLRLNWKKLTLRFEFPLVEVQLEVLKSKGLW